MPPPPALFFSTTGAAIPPCLLAWGESRRLAFARVESADDLMAIALRGRPRLVAFDGAGSPGASYEACRRLKGDSYTGVVPAVFLCGEDLRVGMRGFEAGADEVLTDRASDEEAFLRLDVLLRRSDRDVFVHPSTRLPGTHEIEAEIGRRLASGAPFAVCYADLDHFKEYNDRYSYYEGDRVIRILAKILHDVVKGVCGEDGFVGHIGGDDFIFIVPAPPVHDVCAEVIAVFDALVPYQYSEQDRRAGYYFGKDRRGQLHRVPLMTVSIGVVTNERRVFHSAAQVSGLATEMKSYAKTLPGSVYTIDRRNDPGVAEPEAAARRPNVSLTLSDEP